MKTIKTEKRSVGDIIFRVIFNILMAVILFVFLVSAAVFLVLALKSLYYWYIDLFKIEAYSGYTADALKANYDALIDYNMFWGPKELVFPDHGMVTTEQTMAHFVDVKQIFVQFQYAAIASAALLIPGCVVAKIKNISLWPKLTLILALAVIVSAGIGLAFYWDQFFIKFHEIVFPGKTNWYINANYDKVILILPSEVFLADAAAILGVIALGILLFLIFFRKRKDPEVREQKKQAKREKREARKAEKAARKAEQSEEKEEVKAAEETVEESRAAAEESEKKAEASVKEELNQTLDEAEKTAEETAENAEAAVEEAAEETKEAAEKAEEKAEEAVEKTEEKAEETVEKAEAVVEETVEETCAAAEETVEKVEEKAEEAVQVAEETVEESRAAAEENVKKAAEAVETGTTERFEEMDEEIAKTVEAFDEAFEEIKL